MCDEFILWKNIWALIIGCFIPNNSPRSSSVESKRENLMWMQTLLLKCANALLTSEVWLGETGRQLKAIRDLSGDERLELWNDWWMGTYCSWKHQPLPTPSTTHPYSVPPFTTGKSRSHASSGLWETPKSPKVRRMLLYEIAFKSLSVLWDQGTALESSILIRGERKY